VRRLSVVSDQKGMPVKRDFSAFFDDGVIEFDAPSNAHPMPAPKTYRVEMDAERGLWLSGLVETATLSAAGITVSDEKLAELKLDDNEQVPFARRVLGETYDELMTDGVSWPLIRRIVSDIFVCFTQDETAANQIIEQSLAERGKAEASANRASRRAAKNASPKASSPAPTAPKQAGSRSNRASGATKARGKAAASTPSSTSTPTGDAAAQTA
jgi:hypothetical protein